MTYECPACDDSFSSAHGVKSHHKQAHGEQLVKLPGEGPESAECPTCGEEFESERAMKVHHGQMHDERLEPPPGCDGLRERYLDEGRPTTTIAEEFAVSTTTVQKWMDRCDIEPREMTVAKTEGDIDRLRDGEWLRAQYCDREQSMSEIASKCDVSLNAVKTWLDRHGITQRSLSEEMADGEVTKLHDEEWLRTQYVDKERSMGDIGDGCGVSISAVGGWLDRHGIERRGPSEAQADGDITPLKDPEWLRAQYWNNGRTATEIADELGVYGSAVNRWLDRHGIEKKGQSVARAGESVRQLEDGEWLREQYHEKGLSTVELGEKLGVSSRCVNDWMERHEIERRGMEAEENPMWKGGADDYYGPSWHSVRREVRERDDYECQRCGMPDEEHVDQFGQSLHVHHIRPFRTFEEHTEANRPENLITLCRECHDQLEGLPIDSGR